MNGFCDIAIIGNGFGQKLESKFMGFALQVKTNLLKREPFLSRASQLRFTLINSKQDLGCVYSSSLNEGTLICDEIKLKKLSGGKLKDITHVLSWKDGGGGANGGISTTGLNQLIDPFAGNPNYCNYNIEQRAFDGISIHEIGHDCGLEHDFTIANVMSYATNGGCFLVGQPFTYEHQQIISAFIDKAINKIQ